LVLTEPTEHGKGCVPKRSYQMEATLAKPNWGLKRTCLNCSERFYDMGREPIICPNCEAKFDPLALVKSRRARAAATNQAKADAQPVADSTEKDVQSDMEEIEIDEDLTVDAEEIDLDDDSVDLIHDTEEIDADTDVSEAVGKAQDENKEN